MCRLAAYIGPPIRLSQFLLAPPHGLLEQALKRGEMRYASFNADGFGVGWYAADGLPAVYVNPAPIWSDANLAHLARSLEGNLWLAAVRSATLPYTSGAANTQPFCDKELIFLHNGFIDDFIGLRRTLRDVVQPHIEAQMRGHTDSEHLFALLRHLLDDADDLTVPGALGALFELLAEWLDGRAALLNVVVSDGRRLYAARHAINDACPSLYYSLDDDAFPGGQLVASERLTGAGFWQPVPEHHLLVLDPQEPPELIAL
ncbi:MAG: class II glutamine amidotransferase [Pseudomonadota bacterium]|nr:class II glutamine amidotransferase [Pseudomonadota bacterium]